mmetsp:Transcript_17811/g.24723  ORF Transcript_17811/g.24723 Transcript_17811/m.24723 type:complete len:85 (-) Transcript_17811:41-295(-)
MSTLEDDVRNKCLSEFQADHVECTGEGSCTGQAKLELIVVSSQFEGVPLLARHRKVNTALAEYMDQIHALTIKAWTPAQYESKK